MREAALLALGTVADELEELPTEQRMVFKLQDHLRCLLAEDLAPTTVSASLLSWPCIVACSAVSC